MTMIQLIGLGILVAIVTIVVWWTNNKLLSEAKRIGREGCPPGRTNWPGPM